MKSRNIIASATVATALILGGATSPAFAEATADQQFAEFVEILGVSPRVENALEKKFDQLPAAEQEVFLAAAMVDPTSVMEMSPVSAPALTADATTGGELSAATMALAATSVWTANQSYNVNVLGIQTGTFSLRYRFEANGVSVTRNLECTAWWSGFSGFWNISSSSSNWISSGKGTCIGRHHMSLVYQGSFLTANKEQGLTYNGVPTLLSNYIRNV